MSATLAAKAPKPARRTDGPVRTCIGCRESARQPELVRFVVGDAPPYLAPDLKGRLGGRGYWVGARRTCLEQAMKRSVIRDALPTGATVHLGEVASLTAMAYRRRLQGILQGGWRNGLIALGTSEVHDALVSQSARQLWVAPGGGTTREKARALAQRLGVSCIESCDESLMSDIFGRDTVATLAFLDSALALEARLCLERVNAFSEDA